MNTCRELKEHFDVDPDLFLKVITGDESWCYGYDLETKPQSSQWKYPMLPRLKRTRQVKSNVKMMLICFFNVKGIVHEEFVLPGQTVNQTFYLAVLKRYARRSETKTPRPVANWRVVKRQCASSHRLECETVSDQKLHDPTYPPTLFARFCSL
ncbi:hypothetical protein Pcinc_006190 [Petrolisthes cinctipes]|uniref:Mariner Mos1 transposase n=1 Tax=Petrolisthes cinctipes TaxID=88211 RepID=A0AAE1KZT4_PETCI|nr:hypothetical protein Pcinc_006190 [Petrolisthes cinctipes]